MKTAEAKKLYTEILARFPDAEKSFLHPEDGTPGADEVVFTLRMIQLRCSSYYHTASDSQEAAMFLERMGKMGLIKK